METDDIFASLGGSLMKDLMADLDDLASTSNLASLESQLDAAVGSEGAGGKGGGGGEGTGTVPPPTLRGLPPPPGVGLGHEASASASAAALVLDHQQQRMAQMGQQVPRHDRPPPGVVGGFGGRSGDDQQQQQQQQQGADAWAVSLSQFENSLAAQDFLRADTESKKKLREGRGKDAKAAAPGPVEEADDDMLNLVGSLLEEEEEYNPDEEPVFPAVSVPSAAAAAPSSAPSSEVRAGEASKGAAAASVPAPLPPPRAAQDPPPRQQPGPGRQKQHPGAPPGPPPPHLMGPHPPPPPHMMGPPGVGVGVPPPPMMMTPNGPVPMGSMPPPPPPPPHVLAAMQQQQQQHLQQQQQQQRQQQLRQHPPSTDGSDRHRRGRGVEEGAPRAPRVDPLDEASRFRKGDFPTLSSSSDDAAAKKVSSDRDGEPSGRKGEGKEEEEDADAPLIPPRNGGGGTGGAGPRRRNSKGKGGGGGAHQHQHRNRNQKQQQQQPTQILQPPRVALAGGGPGPGPGPVHQPHAQPHAQPHGGRVLFNDPRYSAQPVPAKSVASAVMVPRDLTYVVGAMLRALQTADPHGDDYYFHSLRERRLPGGAPPGLFVYGQRGPADVAPEPVSKETKERAREDELKYRNVVVSRAKDWKEEKQVLGHVVKTDVKRPRALLATTVLRVDPDGTGDDPSSSSNEQQGEDTTLRRDLWRARASVDRGYLALLELSELHRMLMLLQQQRQRQLSDQPDAAPRPPSERQLELMEEVGENVARLHASLGVRTAAATDDGDGAAAAGGKVTGVDLDVLASTLSLPKGREMLARSMERGLLPHPSAEAVLPGALACLFAHPRPANVTEIAAAKEDRLLRSLTGIVRLVHPGLSPSTFLSCLEGVIEANRRQNGGPGGDGVKKVLGVKSRAELMHAILARGGEVCKAAAAVQGEGDGKANGRDICARWTAAEAEFLRMLSSS